MSDKELVKRLRDAVNGEHDMTPHGADCLQAADRIEELINLNEALVELLDTARADAKEAEAYAEELEKEIELNEQEAYMVENDLIKADKEIDDLKAKLAKAVELLTVCRDMFDEVAHPSDPLSRMLNDTLAEIDSSEAVTPYGLEGEKG
jgi:chromosome segregation ATPase